MGILNNVMNALMEDKINGPKAAGLVLWFLEVVPLTRSAAGVITTPLWVESKVAAWGQVTAFSPLMLPIVLLADQLWTLPTPSPTSIAGLVGLAARSTTLAYALFFRFLAEAGPMTSCSLPY